MKTSRKPHSGISGYHAERRCRRPCGGHIVIYDRKNGAGWIDADERWVVSHEPSGLHVAVSNEKTARALMKDCAADVGEAPADIIPGEGDYGKYPDPVTR